jgi:hypothetical protein
VKHTERPRQADRLPSGFMAAMMNVRMQQPKGDSPLDDRK